MQKGPRHFPELLIGDCSSSFLAGRTTGSRIFFLKLFNGSVEPPVLNNILGVVVAIANYHKYQR
jgi:hypothetical protein